MACADRGEQRMRVSPALWRIGILLILILVIFGWQRTPRSAESASGRGLTISVGPGSIPAQKTSVVTIRALDSTGAPLSGVAIRVIGASTNPGSLVTHGSALSVRVTPSGRS